MASLEESFQDVLDTPLGPHQHIMVIMVPYDHPEMPPGDVKHIWDDTRPNEVENAREQYKRWTKKERYAAFHMDEKGRQGEQMLEFDPSARRMMFRPALVGG